MLNIQETEEVKYSTCMYMTCALLSWKYRSNVFWLSYPTQLYKYIACQRILHFYEKNWYKKSVSATCFQVTERFLGRMLSSTHLIPRSKFCMPSFTGETSIVSRLSVSTRGSQKTLAKSCSGSNACNGCIYLFFSSLKSDTLYICI